MLQTIVHLNGTGSPATEQLARRNGLGQTLLRTSRSPYGVPTSLTYHTILRRARALVTALMPGMTISVILIPFRTSVKKYLDIYGSIL